MLLEIYPSGPAQTNGILLGCQQTHRAVIVDAPLGSGKIIMERMQTLGLTPECLLLTHSHWDHIADAAFLKEKYDIPLYVHELDAQNVENPGKDGLPLFVEIQPAKVDHFLRDGQILSVGALKMEVIHTPGHSRGGVCFYLKEEKTLLSGDTLFKGTIGRLDLPTSEPEKMWESLKKLSQLPPDTRVIPGHGEETTLRAENWLSHAKETFGG